MVPRSPYLTEDWYDPITHEHFCAECHAVLEQRGEVVKDHVMGIWRHYGYVSFPGTKATDERGRTIEAQWLKPPRIVKVLLPYQTHVRFCEECFPVVKEHGIPASTCIDCRGPIEESHDISLCEFLWKHTNGYNGPFIQCVIHMDCLPEHFKEVQEYRLKNLNK